MKSSPADAMSKVRLTAGITSIVIGFATFWLSRVFDSGFVHGFFQGATVALMIVGAYLVGAGMWQHRSRGQVEDDQHWLPSRDGAASTPAHGPRTTHDPHESDSSHTPHDSR